MAVAVAWHAFAAVTFVDARERLGATASAFDDRREGPVISVIDPE